MNDCLSLDLSPVNNSDSEQVRMPLVHIQECPSVPFSHFCVNGVLKNANAVFCDLNVKLQKNRDNFANSLSSLNRFIDSLSSINTGTTPPD